MYELRTHFVHDQHCDYRELELVEMHVQDGYGHVPYGRQARRFFIIDWRLVRQRAVAEIKRLVLDVQRLYEISVKILKINKNGNRYYCRCDYVPVVRLDQSDGTLSATQSLLDYWWGGRTGEINISPILLSIQAVYKSLEM